MKKAALGFTLVELLVVITIMAIIGAYAFSNLGSFGEDQKLKSAAQDVQSFLRLAQSNATSGLKCQGQSVLDWRIDTTNWDLKCRNSAGVSSSLKRLTLPANISVDSITAGTCTPTVIIFAPLYGTITSDCSAGPITITLNNSKTGNNKNVVVEQGGRIYVQ